MELATIILTLAGGSFFFFLYFYIVDLKHLKDLEESITPSGFLNKLKRSLINGSIQEKHFSFLVILGSIIVIIGLLIVESIFPSHEIIKKLTAIKFFFLILLFIVIIFYFISKLNKIRKIEKSVKLNDLSAMLKFLGTPKMDIGFYKAIESKFSRSTNEEVHSSLAEFILDTLEIHPNKKSQ